MGLTNSSTGSKLLDDDIENIKKSCNYTIAIAGNPNVGKSTIFNSLTGLHQHTGNWPGKTVENASGICEYKDKKFLLVDIPGTYSLMSHSEEEEIARDYICFGNPDATVVIVDATCLERNLNLVYQTMEITNKVIVCVNLLDEAKSKGININLEKLSKFLGVPVVGTIARKKRTLNKLIETIYKVCTNQIVLAPNLLTYLPVIENCIDIISPTVEKILPQEFIYLNRWICIKLIDGDKKILDSIQSHLKINLSTEDIYNKLKDIYELLSRYDIDIEKLKDKLVSSIIFRAEDICNDVIKYSKSNYNEKDRKVDRILTSKKFGIPIMLLFLGLVFWITIIGANYPSQLLSNFFAIIQEKLILLFNNLNAPKWLTGIMIDGMYQTLSWVIAVMLPPMAIFFPLFTLLEDLGYLPRIAFNLDNYFKKACTTGKQALTMCMGFGCNAAGVVGSKIIDSPREKLISMLTNAFVPCNGRFPFLITIASIFIGSYFTGAFSSIISTLTVLLIILLGIFLTLLVSKILSKTILKGVPSSFILELPPYRKPQVGKILVRSLLDRTLFVLGRAISVAAPVGIVIWIFANVYIGDLTLLTHVSTFLDPFAKLMGLDGYILTAFILGIPANEIVLPIILMSYMSGSTLINLEDTFAIGEILQSHGWTLITGINVMIFTLLHFPCSTTLISIKKESGNIKWAILAFFLPTLCGIIICMITNGIYNLIKII